MLFNLGIPALICTIVKLLACLHSDTFGATPRYIPAYTDEPQTSSTDGITPSSPALREAVNQVLWMQQR